MQRCRPASLTLACGDATDLCELAGERGCVQTAGRGCEGRRAAASSDCEHGAARCAARGGEAAGCGGAHGADAELSALMRTLSPSDFSFSELLSGEGGRAGSAFARSGSGARRSLKFEGEPCGERGLCDSSARLQPRLTARLRPATGRQVSVLPGAGQGPGVQARQLSSCYNAIMKLLEGMSADVCWVSAERGPALQATGARA